MTYEFKCRTCSKKFELVLTVAQYSGLRKFFCPYCESEHVARVFRPLSITYNGKGFYSTDSRKDESSISEN